MADQPDIKRQLGIDQHPGPNELPPLTDFTVIKTIPPKPAPVAPRPDHDSDDDSADD